MKNKHLVNSQHLGQYMVVAAMMMIATCPVVLFLGWIPLSNYMQKVNPGDDLDNLFSAIEISCKVYIGQLLLGALLAIVGSEIQRKKRDVVVGRQRE